MKDLLTDKLDWLEKRLDQTDTIEKSGRILNVNGLVIESEGPEVALGEVCRIESPRSGESALQWWPHQGNRGTPPPPRHGRFRS